MRNRIVVVCLAILSVTVLLFPACAAKEKVPAAPAPAPTTEPVKTIVLKAVAAYSTGTVNDWGFETFIKRVNERSKGELKINLLGGPEVIAEPDQAVAAMQGVVDVVMSSPARLTKMVPEIDLLQLKNAATSIKELKDRGVDDIYVELLKKNAGVYYLGMFSDVSHMLYTTKVKVTKPGDLKGLKIRVFPTVSPIVERWGATPVPTAFGEIYTAAERGLVDGLITVLTGYASGYRYNEVTKYCIDHDLISSGVVGLVNLNTWNRLPKNLQDLMLKTQYETLDEIVAFYRNNINDERKLMAKTMEFTQFSPADAKWYKDLAHDIVWESTKPKVAADIGAKLKDLITR